MPAMISRIILELGRGQAIPPTMRKITVVFLCRIIGTHRRSRFLPSLAFTGLGKTAVAVRSIVISRRGGGGRTTTRSSFGTLFGVQVVQAVDAAAGLLASDVDV